jgi:RNA polymerase sigma factor (sigma-70 family)
MIDDTKLLQRYAAEGDESAFRELVERHCGLVFSTALRLVGGDAHLAHDVSQSVFTDLARKARFVLVRMSPPRGLTGWLYTSTRFAASNVVRAEQRRLAYERKAQQMNETLNRQSLAADLDWNQLRPVLDAAMGQLSSTDRDAVLSRFFLGHSFRDVGKHLGIGEDAAQKRVSRALERLRLILARRGLRTSATALGVVLMANVVSPVPSGLAATITSASLVAAAEAGTANLAAFIGSLTATVTFWATAKLAWFLAGLLVVGGGAAFLMFGPWHYGEFRTIDLTAYYNARTTNSTLSPVTQRDRNNLAEFPTGTNRFAGVPFTVGGVIQLAHIENTRWQVKYPDRVSGIPIGMQCRRLHLLHGAGFTPDSLRGVVAYLALRFQDGQMTKIPIIYGRNIQDWWYGKESPDPLDPGTAIAWRGSNPEAASKGQKLRIYRSTFPNPRPGEPVQSIDYVSTLTTCAPFLLGLTVEQ